jgi:hypothetical protein
MAAKLNLQNAGPEEPALKAKFLNISVPAGLPIA